MLSLEITALAGAAQPQRLKLCQKPKKSKIFQGSCGNSMELANESTDHHRVFIDHHRLFIDHHIAHIDSNDCIDRDQHIGCSFAHNLVLIWTNDASGDLA